MHSANSGPPSPASSTNLRSLKQVSYHIEHSGVTHFVEQSAVKTLPTHVLQ